MKSGPIFWTPIAKLKKVQETSGSEILRINNVISILESKIRAGVANNNMIAVQKHVAARRQL